MFHYANKLKNKLQLEKQKIENTFLWDFRSRCSSRCKNSYSENKCTSTISGKYHQRSMLPALWKKSCLEQPKGRPNVNGCVAEEIGRGTIIKSVFDYRFDWNKHTHVSVTQAFLVFIVRIQFFWCAIWVYFKSLNASPAYDCWAQIFWHVIQRYSDTAGSYKPRIVI